MNDFKFLEVLPSQADNMLNYILKNQIDDKKNIVSAREMFLQDLQNQKTNKQGGIVVINLIGPIIKYDDWFQFGTQTIIKQLQQIAHDKSINCVIFNIDSAGGMVDGTAELADYIYNFPKTIIAYSNGYLCSAAYHIASAATQVIVSQFAQEIGSIGTMCFYYDYIPMLEKQGAKIYEVYAPQSTLKNLETNELKKENYKPILRRLEKITDLFIGSVEKYRGSKIIDDGDVFKGRTYSPGEALKVGLIDNIMSFDELVNNL